MEDNPMRSQSASTRGLLSLVFITLFFCALPVYAADSTSFDPTLVNIKAKSTGGGLNIGDVIICMQAVCEGEKETITVAGVAYPKMLELNGQWINPAVYPELAAIYGSNLPDTRGLFLRGHGEQWHYQHNGWRVGDTWTRHYSGPLDQVQGDAIREIRGSAYMAITPDAHDGVFSITGRSAWDGRGSTSSQAIVDIMASLVTPTADEIRPANMAVRYLVCAVR
jgi:hypothetical protein